MIEINYFGMNGDIQEAIIPIREILMITPDPETLRTHVYVKSPKRKRVVDFLLAEYYGAFKRRLKEALENKVSYISNE